MNGTHTLRVPGAVLAYDVCRTSESTEPQYGQTGEPDAFAAQLREVLAGRV